MKNVNVLNSKGLLDAIAAMKENNTPENQSNMMDKMVNAQYLAPVTITPPPEINGSMATNLELPPDAQIRFHMIESGKGERFFLAFTSFDEMKKWRANPNVQSIIVTFDDYAGMLKRAEKEDSIAGFVIDPFGANLIFAKDQTIAIKELKDKRENSAVKRTIAEGKEIYVGAPVNYPTELVEAVKAYLETQNGVKNAYLQLKVQDEDESYLIVLEYEGDKQKLFNGLAAAARPYLSGMFLDIMGTESELGGKIAEKADAFYTK